MFIFYSQQLLIILKKRQIPMVTTQDCINHVKDLIKGLGLGNLNILQMLVVSSLQIVDKLVKIIEDVCKVDLGEFDVVFEELQCLKL